MRHHLTVIAIFIITALSACITAQDRSSDATSVHEPAPAKVADPMANFARLVGGEWQVTFTSGASAFHAWQWGPGKHSIRRMSNASNAVANPWAGEVVYWHPGRKQVCLLSLHGDIPGIGRGVCEGTIRFEGETEVGAFDLYQPGAHRKLGQRRAFNGPDKYHEILLEATGPDGLQPLAEWDFFRINAPAAAPHTAEEAPPKPSKHLKVFEALLGCSWEAKGVSATGDAFHIQSTYEWVPSLEVICARTNALSEDGKPTHLLDAYFYHHIGTDALRCLALSSQGGVYEGDVTALDGGGLQLDLKGYEGDRVVSRVVRFDFEKDGTLRNRVWSVDGADRTLLLDVHHTRLAPKKGGSFQSLP